MNIEFPMHYPGVVDGDGAVIRIPCKVDGEWVKCVISMEALQDHFGLTSFDGKEAVEAFEANRDAIELKARTQLELNGGHPVILKTVDFP